MIHTAYIVRFISGIQEFTSIHVNSRTQHLLVSSICYEIMHYCTIVIDFLIVIEIKAEDVIWNDSCLLSVSIHLN